MPDGRDPEGQHPTRAPPRRRCPSSPTSSCPTELVPLNVAPGTAPVAPVAPRDRVVLGRPLVHPGQVGHHAPTPSRAGRRSRWSHSRGLPWRHTVPRPGRRVPGRSGPGPPRADRTAPVNQVRAGQRGLRCDHLRRQAATHAVPSIDETGRADARPQPGHPRPRHHPRAHPVHRVRRGPGLQGRRVEGGLLHRRMDPVAGHRRGRSPWPPPRTTRRSRAPPPRRPAWRSRSSSASCCWSSPCGAGA